MPITLNGSGTMTGISAGGLPDGIIQSADLASSIKLGLVKKITTGTSSSQITTSVTGTGGASGVAYLGVQATITPVDATDNFILIFSAGHIITNQSSQMGFRLYASENNGTYADIGMKSHTVSYSQGQQNQLLTLESHARTSFREMGDCI